MGRGRCGWRGGCGVEGESDRVEQMREPNVELDDALSSERERLGARAHGVGNGNGGGGKRACVRRIVGT